MSIALPALLITLLILPGVLLSYCYRKGLWRSPIQLGPLQDEIGRGVLWAIPINLVAFTLADVLPTPDVDFDALVWLLTGYDGMNADQVSMYMKSITSYPISILGYLLIVNLSGATLGFLLHYLVRRYHFDLKYEFLRFKNEWHYLFSGEARFFELSPKFITRTYVKEAGLSATGFAFVTLALEQGKDVYLYRGILSDYFFERGGHLDKIILEAPERRIITADEGDMDPFDMDDRFYRIEGDFFVIKYKEVKNLNIYYFAIYEEDETMAAPKGDEASVSDANDTTEEKTTRAEPESYRGVRNQEET